MNPEQRSTGPLPTQSDPDSSQPDAEPGQRSLSQTLAGRAAVETTGDRCGRRRQINIDRRFARPVRGQLAGGADSLRSHDAHGRRHAP